MDPVQLSILNQNPVKLPGPSLLHHLVAPPSQHLALEHLSRNKTTSYTYSDLHDASDAIAKVITGARCHATHSSSEFVVPILIPQSCQLYVSLVAVLKAGGAFCPIPIDAPLERIRFILQDVSAQVILVAKDLAGNIPPNTGVNVICVDDLHEVPHGGSSDHREASPGDLAYVMYTSGSTGTPKGVAISHSAVTQALLAHGRHIPQFGRFLQFAASTFDVSVFEIFFPLYRGSTLVSVRRQEMLDDLPAVIRTMDVDACELTPTVAGSLLRRRENTPGLRLLLTIGEMLKPPVIQEFGGTSSRESLLWAMYGPTEATIHCTLQTALSAESLTGNIGIPLDSVSCFIIEPRRDGAAKSRSVKVLPIGEIGELAIGGHQLARGYLNRPEQTSAAFIETPYGRLYRTGDKARLTQSGTLDCLGRLSNGQVKLRGQRIELGEIEHAALNTAGCHGAIAAVVDSNLILFCATDDNVTEDTIISSCADWLPQFMIPSEMVLMRHFPQLSSGKVDTKKILSDFDEHRAAALGLNGTEMPTGAHQDNILGILSNILGIAVSSNMTIAAAGIDSLAAIKLASALRLQGFEVKATELLKLKKMSDICYTLLNRASGESSVRDPVRFQELSRGVPPIGHRQTAAVDCLPCTSLQSAMLAETVQNAEVYCNEIELLVNSSVSCDAVCAAILQVSEQNEVLRMGFSRLHGNWVAIVFKSLGPKAVQVVPHLRRGFALHKVDDFLTPLRVQIETSNHESGRRILVQAHHAVFDGWSIDMMLSDLSILLAGALPLPRPQFREFLHHHLHNLESDAEKRFWSEYFLGWHKIPFPKLVGKHVENRIEATREVIQLSPQVVRESVSKLGLSAQVPFQASLAFCWGAIVGAVDVVIGSVTSGRTLPVQGIDRIMGPCIASLPLRVGLGSTISKLDLLRHIHGSNRTIMDHVSLPLVEVKKSAGLQPAESLYDVLFVYQESLLTWKEKKAQIVSQKGHLDRLETKLLVEVEPRDGEYALQATFHSAYFPSDFVDCFMQQFSHTLQHILQEADPTLSWNGPPSSPRMSIYNESPESFTGIPDLATQYETTAAQLPNSTALVFSASSDLSEGAATSFTYRQLNQYANEMAHYLRSCGVQTDQVLAIIMDKSPTLYIAILGVIKAGCAYLPILPSTPIMRIRKILRHADITHCLVDDASQSTLDLDKGICVLNVESAPANFFPRHNVGIVADPSRLAYVIYTSGTTGVPKGVAVTQGNITSNIAHLRSIYPMSANKESRLLQACSQAFDVSAFEIFYAWITGMCLCSATNDVLFSDLEQSIQQLKITHLSLTPTVASLIDPEKASGVEFLVTAGEPMTLSVLDRWGDRLWQGYGPSETTNICSVKHMKRGENIEHLGWVLSNTSVAVLDPETRRVLPIGWVGEFCFGGDQVAQGYVNDAERTTEKFICHPRLGRTYCSGDMGRMLSDGSLVILGRLDDQLKLRGQRIEAGEINSIVTGTGLASTSVTKIVRRKKGAPDQLAAFYVPLETHLEFRRLEVVRESHRMLFGSLKSKLPSYMVPSYLVPVSIVPRTSSGKVDGRRLQACFEELSQEELESVSCSWHTQDDDDEDWSSTELILAGIIAEWAKVRKDEVGRWTPFAALGVDSISAIDLSRAISSRLDTRVPISAVLENPSIAQLGRYLGTRVLHDINGSSQQTNSLDVGISDKDLKEFGRSITSVEDILPCTPLQEAMLAERSNNYSNKTLLRLHIDAKDLMMIWDKMTQRHGILRTFFLTTRDAARPMAQVVLKEYKTRWREFEIHETCFAGVVQEHCQSLPEALDSGKPPLTCAIVRYGDKSFFSFICHHTLYDGVAMGNLWSEMETLAKGGTLPYAVPFRCFIEKALDRPHDTESFWVHHFRDFEPSPAFLPSGTGINQATHTTSLDMTLSHVQQRLQSLGSTLLPLCQAAWAQVLAFVSGSSDVSFGNVVNGRTLDLDGLDRLVAPCFNTIPMRKNMMRKCRNIEVIREFQSLNVEMMRYQFTSVRDIQRFAKCKRRNLFDTILLLQQPLQDRDDTIWTLEEESGNMNVPVVCEVVPCPNLDSMSVNMHHNMSAVSRYAASMMAEIFKYTLKRLIQVPLATLEDKSDLPEHLRASLDEILPSSEKPKEEEIERIDNRSWTSLERDIQIVLADLSGVPGHKISRRTSIFRLGLDSINAVQIASILRQRGLKISASDVMEFPNCESLAERILRPLEEAQSPALVNLKEFALQVAGQIGKNLPQAVQIEAILPCTPVQSAMLASFLQSQGDNYLNMVTYEIHKGFGMDDLFLAWKELGRQHPMLRIGFMAVDHRYTAFAMIQHSTETAENSIEVVGFNESQAFDVQHWRDSCKSTFLENLHMPPWKVALMDTGGRVSMSFVCHHALYDAHSLERLLGSLSDILHGDTPKFANIEPGLTEILSLNLLNQDAAKLWWGKMSANLVVNKFPLMTPLRETKQKLQSHECISRFKFSILLEALQNIDVSVQAAAQAAWARVLAAYIGESSVVFGTTMSGRTTENTQKTPMPCITTVPVIAAVSESNEEMMRHMMAYNAELHKHQFAPLSQIQTWLGHAANPVFDTLLVYQKGHRNTASAHRHWKVVGEEAGIDYAVSMEIEPTEKDGIRICISFFPDLLPMEQASLLVSQFDATLCFIASNPTGREKDLYKTNPNLFSVTPAAVPVIEAPVELLHQFVELQAEKQPEVTALEFVCGFGGRCPVKQVWSYRELNALGNRVASLLQRHARPSDVVAIQFHKQPEAYFAILGILKAGCAFVALDPNAPLARREFILHDSGASCLLLDAATCLDFETTTSIVRIDLESLHNLSEMPPNLKAVNTKQTSTCYCLYTSGTTGTPKGCEISHENAVQAMMAFQELFRGHWQQDSRWLQFAALHFDVSVLEQYWSWSVGITVVAAPREVILDNLTESINNLGITHIDLTPSLARLTHPEEVPSLCRGVFITGGEQLKQEILDSWGSSAVIYNAYGPTEATIGVTMYPRVPVNGRPSNIGKQFLNVGSYVLVPGTETPVFRGAVGELCVSGKLVGKGYLGRPELTTERFPTLMEHDERIYRTGDLVRLLYDGCFDFLGRADDQVKLRGQRLEIGEIDHAIRTGTHRVKDVATIIVKHESMDKQMLVAFLVGSQSSSQDVRILADRDGLGQEARAACLERLPGYMVPTHFLCLSHMPLSANNKAELKVLRTLFQALSHQELMSFSAHNQATYNVDLDGHALDKIRHVLSIVSGVAQASILPSTSIFDAGVDSISALRLSMLLKAEGFQAASPASILKSPIVGDLVRALSTRPANTSKSSLVREAKQAIQACHQRYRPLVCRELGVSPAEIEYIAPCSPLQQGILSKSMTEEASEAYFNTLELSVDENASAERARLAWSQLVDQYAILRSALINTAEGYIQVALKQSRRGWTILTAQTGQQVEAMMESTRRKWIARNAGNVLEPLEFVHVCGPNERQTFFLHMFHAIYDGTSFETMRRHATALYHCRKPSQGPLFIEALAHGPLWRHEDRRDFWMEHLQKWEPCPMPALESPSHDLTRPQAAVSASRRVPLGAFERLRSEQNVTMQSAVLAAWTRTLQRYLAGKTTIGVIVAGRSMELTGVQDTVGPLFNTLPLFSATLQQQTWASLIRHVHDFSTSILAFQHVPLKKIQKWCSGGRPLFDTLFVFQREQPLAEDEHEVWTVSDGLNHLDYPLAFEAVQSCSGHLNLSIVAQGRFATERMLEDMLADLESAVESAQGKDLLDADWAGSMEDEAPAVADAKEAKKAMVDSVEFFWTDEALVLRHEVANLANVDGEQVGASTPMLQLGLDSIDIMKLSARLKKKGLGLSPSLIMRCQTISRMMQERRTADDVQDEASLAHDVLAKMKPALWTQLERAGVDPGKVESVLPSTALQESMVAGMLQSGFQWYFNHDVLEVSPTTDMQKLRAAWEQVIENSPILRTGFIPIEDTVLDMAYCQVAFRHQPWSIETVHLGDMIEMQQLIEKATQRAIQGGGVKQLCQVQFATHGSHSFVVLSLAHALYDGWSLDLVYQDLEAAYRGELEVRPRADEFIAHWLASTTPEAKTFWANYLDGISATLIPGTAQMTASGHGLVRRESAKVPLSRVRAFCRKLSISLQTLCASCWAMVAAEQTHLLDVVFGLVLAGRDDVDAESLMFPTMNTVVLRCVLHGTVAELLGYIEDSLSDVRRFQTLPLRKALSGERPFNSLFLVQKKRQREKPSSDCLLRSVDGASAVDYPVCVEAEPDDESGCLLWRIAFQGNILGNEADGLVDKLNHALEYMLGSEGERVLVYDRGGVSICGLPAVEIGVEEQAAKDGEEANEVPGEGEEYSEEANEMPGEGEEYGEATKTLLEVVSDVAHVPVEAIIMSSTLYHVGLDSISAIKVSMLLRRRGFFIKPRELTSATSLRHVIRLMRHEEGEEEEQTAKQWVPPANLQVGKLISECGIDEKRVEAVLPATAMQIHMMCMWQNSGGRLFFPEFVYRLRWSEMQVRVAWGRLVAETAVLRTRFVATEGTEVPWVQVVMREVQDLGKSLDCDSTGLARSEEDGLVKMSVDKGEDDGCVTMRVKIHHALYDGFSLGVLMSRLDQLLRGGGGCVEEAQARAKTSLQALARFSIQPMMPEARRRRREFWTDYLKGFGCSTDDDTALKNSPPGLKNSAAYGDNTTRLKTTSCIETKRLVNLARLRSTASRHGISLHALVLAACARSLAFHNQGRTGGRTEGQTHSHSHPHNSGTHTHDSHIQNPAQTDTQAHRSQTHPDITHIQSLNSHTHSNYTHTHSNYTHTHSNTTHTHSHDEPFIMGIYLANRSPGATHPTLSLVPLIVGVEHDVVALARGIQADVQRVSATHAAQVSMWEVYEWTGVRVECFVNVRVDEPVDDYGDVGDGEERVDDYGDASDGGNKGDGRVDEFGNGGNERGGVDGNNGDDVMMADDAVVEERRRRFGDEAWMRRNAVRDAYPPSLDIETSLKGNDLTVGVFGARDRLSDEQAAALVQGVLACLDEV